MDAPTETLLINTLRDDQSVGSTLAQAAAAEEKRVWEKRVRIGPQRRRKDSINPVVQLVPYRATIEVA